MLSNEAAKALGYRDSYLFFLKNPNVKRLWTTEEERLCLAQKGLLNPSFKRRPIAIVTARSVFRSFGYRIIKGGKRGRDCYYVEDDWEDKESEDESSAVNAADTSDSDSSPNKSKEKPLRWFESSAASSPSRSSATSELEWLYNCAQSASEFNSTLLKHRSRRFYDHHTNITHVPLITQPDAFYVEVNVADTRSSTSILKVLPRVDIVSAGRKEDGWIRLKKPTKDPFPLALTEDQFQSSYSL
jgi:hypothetical protein